MHLDPAGMRNLLAFFWSCESRYAQAQKGKKRASNVLPSKLRESSRCFPGAYGEILLVLADTPSIMRVNQSVFEKHAITDVITLAYPGLPGQSAGRAEIFVNVQLALEEGRRRAGATSELALYMAHGCDHLAGADDNTPARRKQMLLKERKWVKKAKELGLIPNAHPQERYAAGQRPFCSGER